jgi:hypothetical protein
MLINTLRAFHFSCCSKFVTYVQCSYFRYELPVDLLQAKLELTDLVNFLDSEIQSVFCYYVILGPELSLQVKQKYNIQCHEIRR